MTTSRVTVPVRGPGHCEDDAAWAEFVRQYDGQPRSRPDLTDFALANRVFMADRNDLDLIVWQTAAKERIRWLSIELAKAQSAMLSAAPAPEGEAVKGPWSWLTAYVEGDGDPADREYNCDDMVAAWRAGYTALATREEAPAEAGERETLRVLLDNLVIAQSLSKELRQRATDEARSYLYALRAQPPAREDARPVAWDHEGLAKTLCEMDAAHGGATWSRRTAEQKAHYRALARTIVERHTHPAPDALRVREALSALVIADDHRPRGLGTPSDWIRNSYAPAIALARKALAALQAEQKGGA
ncbi:hypothetical protein D1604_12515 [Brevundimonas sp. LPMIX5]|uniref:hypothetical protein n=1 Tax=Brevundimonas sp. LPMIX5 TaxID=2305887 RepID=UPI000E66810C|nr:hypothetical protein [Brevundimonas sp. LPMIX5]RIJ65137.1 hypothetical protein D1604_12515 [Brevundimonas sp. LPMIX5]